MAFGEVEQRKAGHLKPDGESGGKKVETLEETERAESLGLSYHYKVAAGANEDFTGIFLNLPERERARSLATHSAHTLNTHS